MQGHKFVNIQYPTRLSIPKLHTYTTWVWHMQSSIIYYTYTDEVYMQHWCGTQVDGWRGGTNFSSIPGAHNHPSPKFVCLS